MDFRANYDNATIAGGGPAGSATAILLSHAGFPATLIERTSDAHDKVCGDFLSGAALAQLGALGISPDALGAVGIGRVRLIHRDRIAEASLPFRAAGLSRRALDEALLAAAGRAGAQVRRGETVRALRPHANEAIVLATGKHDLHQLPRPGSPRGAVGFKTYLALASDQRAALADAVELVLLAGGYAGLQSVEGGRASLCVMLRGPPPVSPALLLDWLAGQAPHLRRRLAGARPLLARPLGVARVPYGHLQAPEANPAWLFRAGDQAAVIPSLAGDGVAIALRSASLAASALLANETAAAYHRRLRSVLRRPVRAAMAVHRCALRSELQPAFVAACRLSPGLIRFTAALTRCYQPLPP